MDKIEVTDRWIKSKVKNNCIRKNMISQNNQSSSDKKQSRIKLNKNTDSFSMFVTPISI